MYFLVLNIEFQKEKANLMEGVKVCVYENEEEVGKQAALKIYEKLKEQKNIGLATGSTPIPCYKALIELLSAGDVNLNNIHTFNLDEYIGLKKEHEQSYHFFMQQHLFQHISKTTERPWGLNVNHIHFPEEGEDYEKVIEKLGGIGLQVLGIGHNGHIGFNEPGILFVVVSFLIVLTRDTLCQQYSCRRVNGRHQKS